ncbi:MAG: GGDEF domain-containing protein [Rhizobiaceae bacterium]
MLNHLALHDTITGLANRTQLFTQLQHSMSEVEGGQKMAIHYINLDHFKPINENYGHDTGDTILKAVASRLLDSVRDADTVARIGGDEFVVIQSGVRSARDAEVVGSRIIKAVSRSHVVSAHTFYVGASIGVSLAPRDGVCVEELIRKADSAMNRSKRCGGNQLSFFS